MKASRADTYSEHVRFAGIYFLSACAPVLSWWRWGRVREGGWIPVVRLELKGKGLPTTHRSVIGPLPKDSSGAGRRIGRRSASSQTDRLHGSCVASHRPPRPRSGLRPGVGRPVDTWILTRAAPTESARGRRRVRQWTAFGIAERGQREENQFRRLAARSGPATVSSGRREHKLSPTFTPSNQMERTCTVYMPALCEDYFSECSCSSRFLMRSLICFAPRGFPSVSPWSSMLLYLPLSLSRQIAVRCFSPSSILSL